MDADDVAYLVSFFMGPKDELLKVLDDAKTVVVMDVFLFLSWTDLLHSRGGSSPTTHPAPGSRRVSPQGHDPNWTQEVRGGSGREKRVSRT